MHVLFVTMALLPLALCTPRPPVDPATLAHLMFLDADTDQDGTLHRAEMVAVFDRYDQDGDGRVTRHEYVQYQESHDPELVTLAHFLFDEYDVDNDHKLEAHDYESFYRLLDNDGDDNVSEAEFTNYWTVLLQSLEHHIPGK
ncbi:uncharacterized protein LOC143278087 [Babylonia areolata]|uniref:uncharacterized protein LOC143278087 n=1 Tax=Babylonia areolata TaxID=304850 RepID=UPI003FD196D9